MFSIRVVLWKISIPEQVFRQNFSGLAETAPAGSACEHGPVVLRGIRASPPDTASPRLTRQQTSWPPTDGDRISWETRRYAGCPAAQERSRPHGAGLRPPAGRAGKMIGSRMSRRGLIGGAAAALAFPATLRAQGRGPDG